MDASPARSRLAVPVAVLLAVVSVVAVALLAWAQPWAGGRTTVPASGEDELAAGGGPCPTRLPAPVDDEGGHGFGNDEPAGRVPAVAAADQAWVCRYDPETVAQTDSGGSQFAWRRAVAPRRLAPPDLTDVADVLAGVGVLEGSRDCNADLGPRWLLVTSAAGDLTGTAVDGYGCHDVRLTSDPFATAPGDDVAGNAGGVLAGSADLEARLQDWWDRSEAELGTAAAPDVLLVTCSADGLQVSSEVVAGRSEGVRVVVEPGSARDTYLTYETDGGPSGGEPARGRRTFAFPPGPVTLGCSGPGSVEPATRVVEVVDPAGYWRATTLRELGCPPADAQPSWAVGGVRGASAQEAVDRLLAQLDGAWRAEPAPIGWSGSADQTWLASLGSRPSMTLVVTWGDDAWTASPDLLCR